MREREERAQRAQSRVKTEEGREQKLKHTSMIVR
jgi:hypothetical protein